MTRGVEATLSADDIASALRRHVQGDWGEVDEDDWRENDLCVEDGYRILSAYTSKAGEKFWVITEADRSVTTVLLPESTQSHPAAACSIGESPRFGDCRVPHEPPDTHVSRHPRHEVLSADLAIAGVACYARGMKAFVGEVDEVGLRRFMTEAEFCGDVLSRYSRYQSVRPTTVVWAVLDDEAAQIIQDRVRGERHGDACGLLLNRAVELLALGSALPMGSPPD